jgi:Zn-dependent protease
MSSAQTSNRTAAGPSAFRIGRLAGIEIRVHWSWLLIFALLTASLGEGLFHEDYPSWSRLEAWLAGAITSLAVFACVLIHELAHSLVARREGMTVDSITLFVFGGVSSLTEEPKRPVDEFRMAFAGPLSSFVLAGICAVGWVVSKGGFGTALGYLAFINAALGAFNMLPGFPLDGGRVLRSILWARSGNVLSATRTAAIVGMVLAAVIMAYGAVGFLFGGVFAGLWPLFIGWFLFTQSQAAYQHEVASETLKRMRVAQAMTRQYHAVRPDVSLDAFVSDYALVFHERSYPVMSNGDLEGLVSVSDLQKFPREQWRDRTVAEIMTPRRKLHLTAPADDLAAAAEAMATADVHQLPVLDEGRLAGFVTRADIVRIMTLRKELKPTTTDADAGDVQQTGQHTARITSPRHPHAPRAG